LHEVANYFSLSHHSRGKKGKTSNNRQLIMYPKSQFKEKQEIEKRRMEKERYKLIEHFKVKEMIGAACEPKTFREMVVKDIYEESRGNTQHKSLAE